jgi:hypothetical protein
VKRVEPELITRSDGLLTLLGEELKQSLVAIAQLSEMKNDPVAVNAQARTALKTIDNVLLYQRIQSGQTSLKLEPVHVGSTIHTVANSMEPIMRAAGCRTELHIQHGLSPVDVDRRLLESALHSLWQAFINSISEPTDIICQASKTANGVRLSIHSSGANINDIHLNKRNLGSIQPISGLAGPSADLLTAQSLFALLGTNLSKATKSQILGLGATLQTSRQLQMV